MRVKEKMLGRCRMGLFQCNIYSEELDKNTAFYVSLPKPESEELQYDREKKYQVLYLLHGGGDDYTKWIRRVSIERMTRKYKIAVVAPDASLSYYEDIDGVGNYCRYIGKELPQIVQSYFQISEKREDHFIAGLSMGGFGAFKAALNYPEQFCAAASFSGAMDIIQCSQQPDNNKEVMSYDLTKVKDSDSDLIYVIKNMIKKGTQIPALYQSCGTEDSLHPMNEDFRKKIETLPEKLNYTYEEWEGVHDWIFWEESLRYSLDWFGFKQDYVRG